MATVTDTIPIRWDLPPANLLELIYETMSDGVAVFDANGRVAYCNPAMCILLGRPVNDIVGRSATEAWGSPGNALSTHASSMTTIEERIQRPDGTEKVVTAKSFGIMSNPPLQVNIYRDVTKIRETRKALEDSYKIFHAFMANNPAVATLKDGKGRYIFVNEAADDLLAIPISGWVGKSDRELWPEETYLQIERNDEAVRRTGETMQFEEVLPTPHGQKHFLSFKFLVSDTLQADLLASMSLDISNFTAREEELMRQSSALEIVMEIMAILATQETTDFRRVLVMLGAAVETTCATIAILSADGKTLDLTQHHWSGGPDTGTRSQPRWDLETAEVPWLIEALSEGEILMIDDTAELSWGNPGELTRLHSGPTRAFLAVPILSPNGDFAGFLAVDDHERSRPWTNAEVRSMEMVTRLIGIHLGKRTS